MGGQSGYSLRDSPAGRFDFSSSLQLGVSYGKREVSATRRLLARCHRRILVLTYGYPYV